jgi:hypothetical protein
LKLFHHNEFDEMPRSMEAIGSDGHPRATADVMERAPTSIIVGA